MTDFQALQRYADARDPQAFRLLVENYQGLVFGVCRRRLSSLQDAEDATQETFLKFAKAADEIRVSIAAWLHTCATRTAIDFARRNARTRARESVLVAEPVASSEDSDWQQVKAEVDQAISTLSKDDQRLVIEHYLLGRTQAELAADLEISQSTVSRQLKQALESLRKSIAGSKAVGLSFGGLASALAAEAASASSAVPAAMGAELMKIGLGVSGGGAASGTAVTAGGLAIKAKLLIASGVVSTAAVVGTAAVMMQPNDPNGGADSSSATQTIAEKRDPMRSYTDLLARYNQAGAAAEGQTILRNTIPLSYRGQVLGGKIEGDKISVYQIDDQSGLFQADLRISHSDPKASPPQLDMYPISMNNKRFAAEVKQWLAGRPLQCIYETADFGEISAVIIMGQPDQRPQSFESIQGPRWGMGLIKNGSFQETDAVNEDGVSQSLIGSYMQTQLKHNGVPLEIDTKEDEMVFAFPHGVRPGMSFDELPSSSGVNLYRITHCDPTANPKEIDIRIIAHNNGGWEPTEMGQTLKGIYEIEGGKLLTVFAYPGFNRPLSVGERRDVIRDSAILMPGTKRYTAEQDGQVDSWGVDKALRARWAYVSFAW